jgi:molybdopterin converting factor small subunit
MSTTSSSARRRSSSADGAVRIPPTLRAEVGGSRELEARGDTVGGVIDGLVERYPALGEQLLQDGGWLRS